MMFQNKIDRIFSYFKEKQEERKEPEEELPLEKGDLLALLLSAFLVIVPIALLVLAVLGIAGYFFFFH